MNDQEPRRVFCRTCYWWKRREKDCGQCWHPTQPGEFVAQHDSCEHHERKIITNVELPRLPR